MLREGYLAHRGQAQQAIDQIVKHIVEQYQPQRIILFGSYAYGEPDAGSDVDLLVVKDTNERPIDRRVDRRVAVRRIAQATRHGMPFSPLVITPQELARRLEVGDPFYHEIVGRGKVLYAQA